VRHRGDGGIGYITESSVDKRWWVQWVTLKGKPHPVKEPQRWSSSCLEHYLLPGDKVKLLPIGGIFSEKVSMESHVGEVVPVFREYIADGAPLVQKFMGATCIPVRYASGRWDWFPLLCVKKL
jgi:hypothetical protein